MKYEVCVCGEKYFGLTMVKEKCTNYCNCGEKYFGLTMVKEKKGMCNHTLLDHALLLSHQAHEHQSRAHSVEFPEHFRHKYIYLSETTLLTQMS
jgi:hypothetical protein